MSATASILRPSALPRHSIRLVRDFSEIVCEKGTNSIWLAVGPQSTANQCVQLLCACTLPGLELERKSVLVTETGVCWCVCGLLTDTDMAPL